MSEIINDTKGSIIAQKKISQKTLTGNVKGMTTIELRKWNFQNIDGLSLFIKTDKQGFGSKPGKTSFVFIDIENPEIRKTLIEMIELATKQ